MPSPGNSTIFFGGIAIFVSQPHDQGFRHAHLPKSDILACRRKTV